jgi:hypothetical protein
MTHPEATLEAAERTARIAAAQGLPTLVIGAVALAAHGYVRATGDIDLGVNASLDQLREVAKALEADGFQVELREPDAEDPLGGVVDVTGAFGLVQLVNYGGRFPAVIDEALAAEPLLVREGTMLRVVPLPHLVALKLYAGGLSSLSDVVNLLRANPDADLEAIAALCRRYRLRGFSTVRRELLAGS